MFSNPIALWSFTSLFSFLAAYSFIRTITDFRNPYQSVGHFLHAAMSVVMAVMAWPWWNALPAIPQIIFFSAATLWYLVMLIMQTTGKVTQQSLGGHSTWHQAVHAIMMLAMVWMVAVMAAMDHAAQPEHSGGHAGHHHDALSAPAALTGVAVTAALIIAGVIFTVEYITCSKKTSNAWRGHAGELASGGLMCLGMAAMCLPMIVS